MHRAGYSRPYKSNQSPGDEFNDFKEFSERKIYVIAHSEGTVVAYNSLVQAAMITEGGGLHSGEPEFNRAVAADNDVAGLGDQQKEWHVYDWLPEMAGLVTLGSPLDKHYLIWKNRFRKHFLKMVPKNKDGKPRNKIPWFNFADRSDPVAYELTEIMTEQGQPADTDATKLFNIKEHTFQRYPIPGKAHVDYWTDRAIHEHIIHNMMDLVPGAKKPAPLADGWWAPLQPVGDYVGYVIGRVAALWFGLFFLSRLLSISALNPVREWSLMAQAYQVISTQPFGTGALIVNYVTWLLGPILVMAVLVKAEKGRFGSKWWPEFRRSLAVVWLLIAVIICISMSVGTTGSGITDMLGYGTGLVVTVLIWRLHTAVNRGLIQLWRYTKVL